MSDRTKIRRGPARGKATPRGGRSGAPRPRVQSQSPSGIAALVQRIPITADQVRHAGNVGLMLMLGAGVVAGVVAMKLPQMVGQTIGEAVGSAGFVVRSIEIKGLQRMDRDLVYSAAANQQSQAMPLVDLDGVRNDLLRHGWVADARVSRRLPDTLVVDILERKPAAIWQNNRRLNLIDASGTIIAPVDIGSMPDNLPIVIGPGANRQADQLTALLDAVPQLKAMLAGATWIGDRRWDLRFHSGETLALPQQGAEAALRKFAEMDGRSRLLGQGFVRFDMRVPDKMVVRVSREPGQSIEDIKKERAARAAAAEADGADDGPTTKSI